MDVNVIKSNRRTISIQIKPDLSVTVRAPFYTSDREIKRILSEKEAWIKKHLEKMREKKADHEAFQPERLTKAEIDELRDMAKRVIPDRVRHFAELMGVDYGSITIRNQKTRWGSCTSKGNLSFNCMLMRTSPEVIDYVVVHELCHRKQMNHSAAFWREVEKVLPDYRERRRALKAASTYLR